MVSWRPFGGLPKKPRNVGLPATTGWSVSITVPVSSVRGGKSAMAASARATKSAETTESSSSRLTKSLRACRITAFRLAHSPRRGPVR
jgi:hypothetical protein